MKNLSMTLGVFMFLLFSVSSFAQNWQLGGNNPPPLNATNNIFGTNVNLPIRIFTSGGSRMVVNANLTTTISGVNKQFNGFVGISPSGYFNTNTPYTMLHLYGKNNAGGFGPGGGWRQWMETGLLMNENSDGMYVGLKEETGTNRSDAIINWSDDPTGGSGPDKLRFIHTGANSGNGNGQLDPRDPFSLDGYEYMRMTAQGPNNLLGYASGHIGIGPLFTNANFPQARLHMHSEDNLTNYLQISIDATTGITAADGTRLGVLGAQATTNQDGNALLYNQEKKHLLFSTAHATPTNINNSFERMRITSYDAETTLPGGGYGSYVPDPLNPPGNPDITRVSISHNPALPVVRPLSLLHLGYDTGGSSLTPGATDGWRSWMNIGMFTSNSTDNVYIGLKREPASILNPNDRNDAVINWGDNQANSIPTSGPDNMRFIFTATQTGSPTTAPANGFDGLEAMRMTPTLNTGVFTGIGGDPNANPYVGGNINASNTLEVNSWGLVTNPGGSSGLRFTDLNTSSPTVPNPGTGVLAVDAFGDVIYVPGGGLGNYCGLPTNSLTADYEIDMDDKSIFFRRGGTMYIGDVFCGQTQPARVFIRNTFSPTYTKPIALQVESSHGSGNNFAGYFQAQNTGSFNVALYGACVPVNPTPPTYPPSPTSGNFAGYFDGDTYVSGRVYVTQVGLVISDQNIKTDIDTLSDALVLIDQLKPRSFYYDSTAVPDMKMPEEKQYGFIAQDVEMILPELVSQQYSVAKFDSLGNVTNTPQLIKNLNYNSFIAILTKGVQELNSENEELQNQLNEQDSINNSLQDQINTLYSMITSCCSNNSNSQNNSMQQNPNTTLDITLSDNVPSIVLDQNVPNPFAEQTTITYTLTDGVKKAQMLFYNIEGKLIQAVDLSNASGKGQMNVFANDLSTGVYTYTLVVDGEIKGTKRMVKE